MKVLVWGAMSWRGLGKLAIVEGTMDSQRYINTLQTHLLSQAAMWFPSGDWQFQQDGARCHTSRATLKFLEDNNIPVLPWTANSPDMNPIEHVWALLKKRVYGIGAETKDELITNIKAVAEDQEYWNPICHALIESMTERVCHVSKTKGSPWC